VIASDLVILFCGINPSLYSGAVGHPFAGPGNRFWKALHGSGFTERELSAFESRELLDLRLGVTNLVERSTADANELSRDELREGARRLVGKAEGYRPSWVAVLGIGAYQKAFDRPRAIGQQAETLGTARLWVLPNPSGRAAAYPLPTLIAEFSRLREAAGL
jgi:double-stranded uracil-DNA glycosylase